MTTPYTFFADLATEAPIPARGILSQTLSNEGDIEFLLFAFAAGEQLSEHPSARPAIIHILEGEGELTRSSIPDAWLYRGCCGAAGSGPLVASWQAAPLCGRRLGSPAALPPHDRPDAACWQELLADR